MTKKRTINTKTTDIIGISEKLPKTRELYQKATTAQAEYSKAVKENKQRRADLAEAVRSAEAQIESETDFDKYKALKNIIDSSKTDIRFLESQAPKLSPGITTRDEKDARYIIEEEIAPIRESYAIKAINAYNALTEIMRECDSFTDYANTADGLLVQMAYNTGAGLGIKAHGNIANLAQVYADADGAPLSFNSFCAWYAKEINRL